MFFKDFFVGTLCILFWSINMFSSCFSLLFFIVSCLETQLQHIDGLYSAAIRFRHPARDWAWLWPIVQYYSRPAAEPLDLVPICLARCVQRRLHHDWQSRTETRRQSLADWPAQPIAADRNDLAECRHRVYRATESAANQRGEPE